jgi:hypothetical protein
VKRLLLLAVVLGAAVLAPAAAAKVSYCAPTGDFCTSVAKVKGVRTFRLTSFAFNGGVKVCVRDPKGGRVCRRFQLTNSGPAYNLAVRWRRHFPDRGPGTYRVTFTLGAARLGPVLAFVR